jgi:hypothetical protein
LNSAAEQLRISGQGDPDAGNCEVVGERGGVSRMGE